MGKSRRNKLNREVLNNLVQSHLGWVSLQELAEYMNKANPRSSPTIRQVGMLTRELKKEYRKKVCYVYVG